MIIFTNVRKSIDYKDFILLNVHPTQNIHPPPFNFIQKTGPFIDKKRDTLERMSLYLALSRDGQLKNRGRPWPREWSRWPPENVLDIRAGAVGL